MAFSDNLNNSGASQNLTDRVGFTLVAGSASDCTLGSGAQALSSLASGEYMATMPDQGSSDQRVTASQLDLCNAFITIRTSDINNWIGYRNNLGNYQVYKRVGSSFIQLGSDYASTPTPGSPHTVVLEGEGDQIRFTINGVARCGAPFTEAFNQSATTQALVLRPDANGIGWLGDISIQSLSADTTNPTLSGSITVGTVTTSSIQMSWPAGSDNVAVSSYEVSSNGGTSYSDVGNVLTHTFTGLASSTSYSLRVRAKDAAGNVSTALSATQSTSSTGASITSTALANLSGSLQLSEPVYYSWFPGGRVGSLTGITPVEGTTTTTLSTGTITVTGLSSGAGVLFISIRKASGDLDLIAYEALTAA